MVLQINSSKDLVLQGGNRRQTLPLRRRSHDNVTALSASTNSTPPESKMLPCACCVTATRRRSFRDIKLKLGGIRGQTERSRLPHSVFELLLSWTCTLHERRVKCASKAKSQKKKQSSELRLQKMASQLQHLRNSLTKATRKKIPNFLCDAFFFCTTGKHV